jgi:hypothetical protein
MTEELKNRIETTMQNLRRNKMEAYYCDTSKEACELVKSLIKKGDVIVPLFDYVVADTGEWAGDYYEGDEYKVKGKLKVTYDQLYAGDYDYSFRIYDVFGGVLTTESTGFGVDEDGSITFFD